MRQPCDEAMVLSSGTESPCAREAQPWVLAATILGSSLVFIDGTVVNVAIPALQQDLGASAVDAQWVIEAYALMLAALLLVGGALGDLYGRRRIYLVGTVIFAAASIWCGLAPSIGHLIAARAVQGIGGALLVPGSLAIISASFSKEDRGKAIGTWSGFSAITAASGPVLGGWLIENASWRWAFFVNVPLAVAVLSLTWWRVPESKNPDAPSLDWPGAILATLGLGGITFGLVESSNRGWADATVIATLVGGALALAVFLLVERGRKNPLLPLELFRERSFAGANLLTLFLYSALSGLFFFLPLNLIQVQGYSATAAGAATLPFVLYMFLLSRWSGGLVERFGSKWPLVIGPTVAAAGFAMFALPGIGGSYWTSWFPAVMVLGMGMAISVAPLTTTVMGAVNEANAGIASGINNAVSRVAAVLAVAVLGIVMLSSFEAQLRRSTSEMPGETRQTILSQSSRLGAIDLPEGDDRHAAEQAIKESFVAGFRLVMLVAAGLAMLGSLSAWLWIANR